MSEKKLFQRLIKTTKALAYWSKELIEVNAAIEKQLSSSGTTASGTTASGQGRQQREEAVKC